MNSSLPTTATATAVYEPNLSDDSRLVARLRDRHQTMLWLSLAIIAAAFILQTRDSGAVGPAFLPSINLPTLCGSRALFGIECPGCGLTRSFLALAAGDLTASLGYHRLGWLLALAVVLQIPYRLFCLRELRTSRPTRTLPIWFGNFLLAALVINWLVKTSGLF